MAHHGRTTSTEQDSPAFKGQRRPCSIFGQSRQTVNTLLAKKRHLKGQFKKYLSLRASTMVQWPPIEKVLGLNLPASWRASVQGMNGVRLTCDSELAIGVSGCLSLSFCLMTAGRGCQLPLLTLNWLSRRRWMDAP